MYNRYYGLDNFNCSIVYTSKMGKYIGIVHQYKMCLDTIEEICIKYNLRFIGSSPSGECCLLFEVLEEIV